MKVKDKQTKHNLLAQHLRKMPGELIPTLLQLSKDNKDTAVTNLILEEIRQRLAAASDEYLSGILAMLKDDENDVKTIVFAEMRRRKAS